MTVRLARTFCTTEMVSLSIAKDSAFFGCMRPGRRDVGRKAAPIVAWRYRQVALERRAHPFLVAEAAAARDAVDALLGFFEQAPGGFQPEQFDRLGRRAAGLGLVASGKVSRRQSPPRRAALVGPKKAAPALGRTEAVVPTLDA